MTGSTLIFGGNKQARLQKIQEIIEIKELPYTKSNPDLLIVELEQDEKSIGIEQVKKALKFLESRPLTYPSKTLVLLDADKITQIAQNTLLKTLEEPPETALIILETQLKDSLLETILSRCKKIEVKAEIIETQAMELNAILQMTLGERLDFAIETSKLEKNEIVQKLKEWILEARTAQNYEVAEKLLKAHNEFEKLNLNQKLFVENLLVNLA